MNCWVNFISVQPQYRPIQPHLIPVTVTSSASNSFQTRPEDQPPKRPRGRPRKYTEEALAGPEVQPRGRPRLYTEEVCGQPQKLIPEQETLGETEMNRDGICIDQGFSRCLSGIIRRCYIRNVARSSSDIYLGWEYRDKGFSLFDYNKTHFKPAVGINLQKRPGVGAVGFFLIPDIATSGRRDW